MIKKGRNRGGFRPSGTGGVRPSDTGKKFVRVTLEKSSSEWHWGVRPSDTGKRFRPSCTTGVCPSLCGIIRQ